MPAWRRVYLEQALADDLSVTRNLFLGKESVRNVGPFRLLEAASGVG